MGSILVCCPPSNHNQNINLSDHLIPAVLSNTKLNDVNTSFLNCLLQVLNSADFFSEIIAQSLLNRKHSEISKNSPFTEQLSNVLQNFNEHPNIFIFYQQYLKDTASFNIHMCYDPLEAINFTFQIINRDLYKGELFPTILKTINSVTKQNPDKQTVKKYFETGDYKFPFYFHSLRYKDNKNSTEFTFVYKLSDYFRGGNNPKVKISEMIKYLSELENSEMVIPSHLLIVKTDISVPIILEEKFTLWDTSYEINCIIYEKKKCLSSW